MTYTDVELNRRWRRTPETRKALLEKVLAELPDEEWRAIEGHPDYFVSDLGRVRRGPYLRKATRTRFGYYRSSVDGREHTIHRLVAAAFLGPAEPGHEVRHLNDDKSDNRLVNLAYGTHTQNMFDAVFNGTHPRAKQTHCKYGHPFDETNTKVEAQGDTGRTRRQCRTCARNRGLAYVRAKRAAAKAQAAS